MRMVAMVMKMRERREEKRLRTSTAIRLPRHPLPHLYFHMGIELFVVRGGWRESWLLLAAAMESHGRQQPSEPPMPLIGQAASLQPPLASYFLCCHTLVLCYISCFKIKVQPK